MIGEHKLYCKDAVVGIVVGQREGMYYKFVCKAVAPDAGHYILTHSGIAKNLGTYIPGLVVRVKVKDIATGEFRLIQKTEDGSGKILEWENADDVVQILQNLPKLLLRRSGDKVGFIIKN